MQSGTNKESSPEPLCPEFIRSQTYRHSVAALPTSATQQKHLNKSYMLAYFLIKLEQHSPWSNTHKNTVTKHNIPRAKNSSLQNWPNTFIGGV